MAFRHEMVHPFTEAGPMAELCHHGAMTDAPSVRSGSSRPAYFDAHPGLLFERPHPGVLLMTLNRPDRLNATDAAMHRALSIVWHDIAADDDTRVVVVTGAGRAFSAGGDLDWITEMAGNYAVVREVMTEAGDIVHNMIACPKIIISAINGVAVGAGLAVGLMADISLIAAEARLTDGHIRLGVGAGDHANILWPLSMGMAKAKYYLLTADFIDGKTADEIGLVSKAVSGAELMNEALALAQRLANGPQDALKWTKRSLNLWLTDAAPAFEASLAMEMLSFLGPDAAEGVAALHEKRDPRFS